MGNIKMVDIGGKNATERTAKARVGVVMPQPVLAKIRRGRLPKGDCLAAAQVAGILAAKNTPKIIPLCHPLRLTHAAVDFEFKKGRLEVFCEVRARDATGVEMEALTGCAVAALTIYDMAKTETQDIVVEDLRLLEKRGGKSDFERLLEARRQ